MEKQSKKRQKNMTKKIGNVARAVQILSQAQVTEKVVHEVYPRTKQVVIQCDFRFNKETFWKLFKKHSEGKYIVDKRNQEVIFTVFNYFLGVEKFDYKGLVKNEASLDKGLLIYGDYGIGKSLLFEILHKIGHELISEYHFKQLWFNCISAGSFIDEYMFAATSKNSNFRIETFYTGTLYIDDLGFEKKAFNKTEVFAELLFERNRKGVKTYCTTNLNPSTIQERYGERIGDRLPEMFNIIKWNGKSFRE